MYHVLGPPKGPLRHSWGPQKGPFRPQKILLGAPEVFRGALGAPFHSVPKKDKKNSATSSWIFSCYRRPLSKWMKRKLLPVAGENPATGSRIFSCYKHLVTRKKAIGKAKRFGQVEQKWKWFFEDLKLFWAHATWYFVPTGLTPLRIHPDYCF